MWIVERGIDEAVILDDTIVRVVSVSSEEIRLAIASPDATPRYREVVLNRPRQHSDSELPIVAPGAVPE